MKELFNSVQKCLQSFVYAFNGIIYVIKNENNMRYHLLATVTVVVCGAYFNVSQTEWIFLILMIGLVIASEMFNSCIEQLADEFTTEESHSIRIIKDMSAGAVLVISFVALLTGAIIFLPKLLTLIF